MAPHYVIVYQIAADPAVADYASGVKVMTMLLATAASLATLGFTAGLVAYLYWTKKHQRRRGFRWFLVIPFCCLLCLLGFFVSIATLFHKTARRSNDAEADALKAFRNGDYQTVEGEVVRFDPMPYAGHKNECFSVQDERFCYSDYWIAPGFRSTSSHGGPVRPGLQVQVAYRVVAGRNTILQLKVAHN